MKKDLESLEGLLGLARRAGKLALGTEAVDSALSQGKVHLLIIANDASQSTAGKLERRAVRNDVLFLRAGSRDEFGAMTSRNSLAFLGILDQSFARGILKILEGSPS
jgi:ribosomal protein L7Ae-like RNA K-turn-binding protein